MLNLLPRRGSIEARADFGRMTLSACGLQIRDASVSLCGPRDVLAARAVTTLAMNILNRRLAFLC